MHFESSKKEADSSGKEKSPKKNFGRLPIFILVGLIAIAASLFARNSRWAQERRLANLNVDELAFAVHDNPHDALTFLYYGSALLKSDSLPASESAFQHAIQLDPKMERAYLGLASAQFHLGKMKAANENFAKAISLDPKEAAAYLGLSETFYQAGSPHSAIEPLKKLIELQPRNAIAWYHLGRLYGEDHQSDLAYTSIKRAVDLDPSQADYWRDLSKLSRRYGKTDEAESELFKALSLSPNDPIAHFWLGQLYAQKGDDQANYEKAEKELLAAVAGDPQMSDGYFELGQLYERHHNYALAVANFKKTCAINDSNDQALYHLGYCLIKTGSKAEGEKTMRASQELAAANKEITLLINRSAADPMNKELHLRLARVYRKYDNSQEALKEYRTYQMFGTVDAAVYQEMKAYEAELNKRNTAHQPGE